MKGPNFSLRKMWGLFLILMLCLGACQKDTAVVPIKKPTRGISKEDLLKDSVYFYTDYFYLWQDQLPTFGSFDPVPFKTAEEVLEALKSYAKDPNGKLLDRFSFLDRSGQVNASIQEGLSGSFGFDVRYNNDVDLFVKLVYPGSPADQAGIKRGWQVLEINGNKNLDLASFDADNFAFLNHALDESASITLKLKKGDGTETTVQLMKTTFQMRPILYSQIYEREGKKIGYFVFDSFISTQNSSGGASYVKNELDQLFANFERQGVVELIVDLRYNGGGAVVTAEDLSNLMVPLAGNKKRMYSYEINASMLADGWKDDFFAPVNFTKTNALNLTRIYFLVTQGSTASASELLINNLNPFIETKLIGETGTYGKPVGFFPWEIEKVDLYAVSFKTLNEVGYGDYFDGLPVDLNIGDDVSKDWGDPQETMLKQALNYAQFGSFLTAKTLQAGRTPSPSVLQKTGMNKKLDQRGNHDMFQLKRGKKVPLR